MNEGKIEMKFKSELLFMSKILRKLKLKQCSLLFNTWRHNQIKKEIELLLDRCFARENNKTMEKNKTDLENMIWVFWWQGIEQMPDLVRSCYRSLVTQLYDKNIVLITKENIKDYCTFPKYIFQKLESGQITLTQLSDILRFDLLAHYGGLYTDATVFWTGNISSEKFLDLYTCGGYSDEYYFNVSKGRWTGFLIGGCKENPLFSFMYNFFLEYWKLNDELIDYFLIDYALDYAYRKNIGFFRDYVDNVAPLNNPNLFELMEIRNEQYSRNGKEELMTATCAFKLSYKKMYDADKNTYASQIVFGNNDGEI